jgi:hypothetical protein
VNRTPAARSPRTPPQTGRKLIIIFGSKNDGTRVVEFRTTEGEVLAISIPRSETAMIRYFQERLQPVRA